MTAPTIELNIRLDVMGNSNNFNHVSEQENLEATAQEGYRLHAELAFDAVFQLLLL
jgi:hypothetical protein